MAGIESTANADVAPEPGSSADLENILRLFMAAGFLIAALILFLFLSGQITLEEAWDMIDEYGLDIDEVEKR